MISRRRYDLVLAIYLQSRGFAFILFEGWLAPVDWGVHEARGADKNAWCLKHVASLFELHTPELLVLQDMSDRGTPRAPRIQELNGLIAELAERRGIPVRTYSRAQVLQYFAHRGGIAKQTIAETIAKHIPALSLYLPPARKPWKTEHPRMAIFEAAALAWLFFHSINGDRQAA